MDKRLFEVMMKEIDLQLSFALKAVDEISFQLRSSSLNTIDIWYSVQSFLVAKANISKMLWPSKKQSDLDRRKPLREALKIEPSSPLSSEPFKFKTMRNNFEHFDKELEKWFEESDSKSVVSFVVGPENSVSIPDHRDIHRAFFTDKFTLYFRGEILDLLPLVSALRSLQPVVKSVIKNSRNSHFDQD